jgi:hypothetical protein
VEGGGDEKKRRGHGRSPHRTVRGGLPRRNSTDCRSETLTGNRDGRGDTGARWKRDGARAAAAAMEMYEIQRITRMDEEEMNDE